MVISANRLRFALLLCAVLVAACGGAVRKATHRFADNLSTAMLNEDDAGTVRDGVPAYLLLIDSMIEGDPLDPDTLLAGAKLYGAYAGGFVDDNARAKHHLAFAVCLEELFAAIRKLSENKIDTFGFGGEKTDEPTVIGWMPSAQIYFRDPDGHMLEFITILPDTPNASFNGRYSEWKKMTNPGHN